MVVAVARNAGLRFSFCPSKEHRPNNVDIRLYLEVSELINDNQTQNKVGGAVQQSPF